MAHILVYLQRTPQGIHPASAVALCVARDIGSERGATITGLANGDAGVFDRAVVSAAGRFGADVVTFLGPAGVANLNERLRPVHVLAPHTDEGLAAVSGLPTGPATPRWIVPDGPDREGMDAISSIIAGTPPWYDLDVTLEAEYEGDVAQATLPGWLEPDAGGVVPADFTVGTSPVTYGLPPEAGADVRAALQRLGASAVDPQALPTAGTLIWVSAGGTDLPQALTDRHPALRLVLLPGPSAAVQQPWSLADWVLPGPWAEAIGQLQDPPWNEILP